MATNTISHQQKVDSVELEADEILELIDQDTGKKGETNIEHYIQYKDELEMISEESDEDLLITAQGDVMMSTPYCVPQGTLKMSSLTRPSTTLPRTR